MYGKRDLTLRVDFHLQVIWILIIQQNNIKCFSLTYPVILNYYPGKYKINLTDISALPSKYSVPHIYVCLKQSSPFAHLEQVLAT